jgi:hypothetical protein
MDIWTYEMCHSLILVDTVRFHNCLFVFSDPHVQCYLGSVHQILFTGFVVKHPAK